MAQKKVILKDGTDELLPKTSASMVFTESGQTVESALKNAGGGGTGDSGIADITSIYSKMNIQNGGILGSDDLATLKGYMEAGKVLKMAMVGATLTFSYNTSGTLIALSSSPMVSPSMYGAMIVFSLLIDSETGEYVGVTDEDSGHLVQQMIPSSVTATQLCTMNGYTKPSAYSALAPTDTLNVALGKLEAGIGSGGTGGGDDTYYLPYALAILPSGSSKEEILSAFGDNFSEFVEAANASRRMAFKTMIGFQYVYIHVDTVFSSDSMFSLSFGINGLISDRIDMTKHIEITQNGGSVSIIYEDGYSLNPELYDLTSSSNADTISTAVRGESGFKAIIQAVKDGNRLVIRGTLNSFDGMTINQDVQCNMYQEKDNGNMTLFLSGKGYGLWGATGGLLIIQYTKSSNTFSCIVDQ